MKLNSKVLAITFSLLWGGCVLLLAVLNTIWPSYGTAFLDLVSSIYPGFHPGGLGAAIVGTLYALLDGAVFGLVLGWLHNTVSARVAAA